MSRDSDPMTRKDGQRLSKINLSNDEWTAIKQLIDVLEPFASATKLLEGSKYATISFMYDVITAIKMEFKVLMMQRLILISIILLQPLKMILVLRILMIMMKLMIIQNGEKF